MNADPPPQDSGMILLNVLAIVAVASAVVMVMVSSQDASIQRAQRMRDAAQADAYALGGEASAITALRRDKIQAPDSDNLREAWAATGQTEVAVRGGRFSLTIEDAQSRFNINDLEKGGLLAQAMLDKILARLSAPVGSAERIARYIEATGPIRDLNGLADAGFDPETVRRAIPYVTALPGLTSVNINTADEALLAAMLDNPVAARVLIARRDRNGLITPADLTAARVVLPTGMGFTSDLYWVRTRVMIGQTRRELTSLVERRSQGRQVLVAVVARQKEAAAPGPAPPL